MSEGSSKNMNKAEYIQVSHSMTFIQGHSLRFNIFEHIFLRNPMPIEAKFHVEHPWDGGMKVSTTGLCHMTKMTTMSIYGKNL